MTSNFLQIVNINSIFAFCTSLFINALLIYMIWFRSTSDLKNYRTFFLIYNAIDVCMTLVFVSTRMLIFIYDGDIVFLAMGPISYFGQWPSHIFLLAQLFFYPFVIAIIPCSYIYRYLLICRNIQLRPHYILLLFFGAFVAVQPYVVSLFFCRQSSSENSYIYANMVSLLLETDDLDGYYYFGGRMV
uniref:G_PROTEIN_RECEP_F1_2 domain-containing protein n=1 Tax=Steinernema glaseri TaxID=37863 RepID=A0A1I8A2H6_9BILA